MKFYKFMYGVSHELSLIDLAVSLDIGLHLICDVWSEFKSHVDPVR
jgi:hypothetical protein